MKAAQDIGEKLGDCEIVSMNRGYAFAEAYDRIGFVFPSYGAGVPLIVKRFIAETDFSSVKESYFFSVVTCGASAKSTLAQVKMCLETKGIALGYGNGVKMFANYVGLYAMADNAQAQALESDKKIKAIAEEIINKRIVNDFKSSALFKLINRISTKMIISKGKGFNVSDVCTGCQMCVELCPVNNISMEDSKVSFSDKCEQCMACIQWCPQRAINYKDKTQSRGRYHHPDISYEDMLKGVTTNE